MPAHNKPGNERYAQEEADGQSQRRSRRQGSLSSPRRATPHAPKRRRYGEKLREAGHTDGGRVIPMARLIAIDETPDKAQAVARRAAEWTVASYIGPTHGNHRQEPRTFGGKEPIAFYLEDVILHGTAESVIDQIRALEADAGMNYLLAAPLSRRTFDPSAFIR